MTLWGREGGTYTKTVARVTRCHWPLPQHRFCPLGSVSIIVSLRAALIDCNWFCDSVCHGNHNETLAVALRLGYGQQVRRSSAWMREFTTSWLQQFSWLCLFNTCKQKELCVSHWILCALVGRNLWTEVLADWIPAEEEPNLRNEVWIMHTIISHLASSSHYSHFINVNAQVPIFIYCTLFNGGIVPVLCARRPDYEK